jgi:lipopolysaccharide export system protein LptA
MIFVRKMLAGLSLGLALLLLSGQLMALESDRKQPLEVSADSTEGTLGDGMAVLSGNVVIRQGSMLVKADIAEIEKADGRVRSVVLTGKPVHLEQEIEEEGLVQADALKIEYEVATGIITLTGEATVIHPQYHVSGEMLKYDMNLQHFQGSGGDDNGRMRIELAPEVVPDMDTKPGNKEKQQPESDSGQEPEPEQEPDSGQEPRH